MSLKDYRYGAIWRKKFLLLEGLRNCEITRTEVCFIRLGISTARHLAGAQ